MNKVIAYNIPGAGLGNRMFINALAYIISLETNRELVTLPIEFFNNTKNNNTITTINNPICTRQYGDQYINFQHLYSHSGDIIVDSFAQRQEYYSKYRTNLKEFFYEATTGGMRHNNTVLYIRNGDYKDIGVYLGNDVYNKILDNIDCSNLTIVVEHIDDDIKTLAYKYNANVFSKSIFEDFLYIKNAPTIIMSQSTFSWWAAFLGEADNVYIPLSTRTSKGWWYIDPKQDEVDLLPPFTNYKYITI